MEPTGRDDAQLVAAARTDEPEAFGPLAQRWFDRCYDLAWHVLHDRELAADVAQDALLTAWQRLDRLEQPASFGGWLLRITRNRALDVLRREVRSVPTDEPTRLEPREDETVAIADPVAAYAREQHRDLVWAAAAALGPRDASLLDLHLRHGLEPHELAAELGVAPNAAHQALFRLRKRLGTAIRAWLLWRDGDPDCVVLRAELLAAGVERFGPELVRLVDRHAASCEDCTAERERVTAPASLFSVVPIVAVPLALRQARFDRLAEAGVPVGATVDLPDPAAQPDSELGDGEQGDGVWGDGAWGDGEQADAADLPNTADLPSVATPTGAGAGDAAGTVGGALASRSPVLTAVASIVVGVVLLAGWLLQGGDGDLVPADAAAEDAASASPVAGPVLPELLGVLPPDAGVASPPPVIGTEEHAGAGTGGEGSALADTPSGDEGTATPDPAGPVTAPPSRPSDTTSPTDPGGADGTDAATEDPSTGQPEDEEPEEPAEPAPAPAVEDLEVVVVGACADGTLQHRVRWTTTDAETATLQTGDGSPTPVPVSGETSACAPRGSTFTLVASGPGGTATRTARAG